ncbi:binding-protein-dependent transport systems inner membrane component [Thermobaculum terrenum ATCC BAA-798]|uniref:Binding-protein-dependent transport systems inner membrane component n=2 Tax=Thermobaculum TaxID=262406 RepID=D1CFP1_THET1|nr:binding-protein-dependent transport systems inner membrane component [Thermobaculum terrenum ATCC BAA-798]
MQAMTRPLTRRSGLSRVLYEARREWTAYLFLSPGLILFAVFTVFSVGFSFYLSFHQWNILEPQKPFVGMQNYRELLHDRYFLGAIVNTLYFAAVSVPVTMAIGLLVALMLNTQIRFRGLFRTLYYLPGVTSLVVAAIIWKWVFSGDYGLLNYYLLKLHIIDKPILWLSDRNLAMPAVITVSVWQGVGFHMVVYLAALQSIPQEIYDAAKVDGASAFRRLIYITVPLLRPTMFFQFVVAMIGSLQVFGQILLMTGGGPIRRTTTVAFYLYQKAFRDFEMGYAAAIAYCLFAMMIVFTIIYWRLAYREIEY